MFLSSHLLDEVEKVCDAAAVIDRGRVVAAGTIAELRTRRITGQEVDQQENDEENEEEGGDQLQHAAQEQG